MDLILFLTLHKCALLQEGMGTSVVGVASSELTIILTLLMIRNEFKAPYIYFVYDKLY